MGSAPRNKREEMPINDKVIKTNVSLTWLLVENWDFYGSLLYLCSNVMRRYEDLTT